MLKLFLLPLAIVALLLVPFAVMGKKIKTGQKSPRAAFIANLCTFAGVMLAALIIPFGHLVSFAAAEGDTIAQAVSTGAGIGYIAAGLAVGMACIGGGIAVGSGAPAAIGATSEDPQNFVKALIFVVLGEGIALYGLLIAILIINAVGG
ncbi:ATP synthase subunit C [Ruminococcus sp.]|uniref:ATP synthase subunit C n=1 Tax=Ruminococcus sp. TaxID=41978 RepID=UPI0025CD9206|nr:ATP synthase subunit C [Ruminococcus sp.]MBQ8967043.1 ATPase [Ruminococcus sp.]